MNYYRTLNEGLNKYIERELGEEEEEEILDEGIFDKLHNKVTNDHFYYVNEVELGKDKKAEKQFWSIVNKTNITQKQRKDLEAQAQGTSSSKPIVAQGKDAKGKEKQYSFEITTQAKSFTKEQNKAEKQATKIQKEVSKMKDTPSGALNSKYVFTVETDKKGKIGVKLGDKTLITYPNKDTAKIALENILKSLNS